MSKNLKFIDADPTSYARLTQIMEKISFSNVFIVMEDKEDVLHVLKNLKYMKTKVRVILLNQWNDKEIAKEYEKISVIDSTNLIAGHLYGQLPNVPLIAQNVGLGRGEIMEIHVPFGSSYAYRHVNSIVQRKWKLVAIYRAEKQILPTNATKIEPNDTLLIVGKPLVLDGVYKSINKRIGFFPEPFGKDIYLLLDFRFDKRILLDYIQEAIYLLEKLKNRRLIIRVIYPNNFQLLEEIRKFESKNIVFLVEYDITHIVSHIEYDISQYNIGMIMTSIPTFEAENLKLTLYTLKKIVYLFGDMALKDIENCIILMDKNHKMESISSSTFDFCDSLGLSLKLGDFNPDGNFEKSKITIEHYETLTHIFNLEIEILQETSNPIRKLSAMQHIIQVAPFEKELNTFNFKKYISKKVEDFLLTTHTHPKLLIPFALEQNNTF